MNQSALLAPKGYRLHNVAKDFSFNTMLSLSSDVFDVYGLTDQTSVVDN